MRVAICDDHRTFTEALCMLLQSKGHDVVAVASRPDEEALTCSGAETILVDLSYPGVVGADAVAIVRERAPDPAIVVLTAHPEPDLLERVQAAGADGVVMKTDGVDELEAVLAKITEARRDSEATELRRFVRSRHASAALKRAPSREPTTELTPRELELLEALAAGTSTTAVAGSMGIGVATVRTHVQHVLLKLGAHSRIEAVATAKRLGLIGSGSR
jgi:two-component system, NarL family, nitrate/nitrite response regulator NarL